MYNRVEIKNLLQKGDRKRLALIIGISEDLVTKVLAGQRKDHHQIIEAGYKMVKQRQLLEISLRQEYKIKKTA